MGQNNCPYTGLIRGHKYVDLGLSVLWATCNVGASSPSDIGSYYAWGEIRTKTDYNPNNSVAYKMKPCGIAGNPQFDAATANWGSPWRCPTNNEIWDLLNECKWIKNKSRCPKGYNVVGGCGNSIFLPAGGRYDGNSIKYIVQKGYYWSSESNGNCMAFALHFNFKSRHPSLLEEDFHYGFNIRPVIDRKYFETETNEQTINEI